MNPDLNIYLEKFSEFSFHKWGFDKNSNAFISPIKTQKIVLSEIDWNHNQDLSHSELLWFYSLGALVKCWVEEGENSAELIEQKLESFIIFQQSENNKYLYSVRYSHSYDHCVAVRIRYLCMLLAFGYPNVDLIHKIIQHDLNWFAKLETIPLNNHGMMLCDAVFHACVLCKLTSADYLQLDSLIAQSSQFLVEIINHIFPKNGYANENTVGYHEFYYKTLKTILTFLDYYHISSDAIETIQTKIESIYQALTYTVWPDGGIPAIGQSNSYAGNRESAPGEYLFNPQGFYVNKDDENYFSYTCGFATTIHKQNDDLSFSLRLKEQNIFLDCGLGSYDSKDTKQLVINGQRGHCGAFFKRFDAWRMWDFFNSKKIENLEYKLDAHLGEIQSHKKFQYNGHYYSLQRDINIINFYNFIIKDQFESDDFSANPVSRFIVPHGAEISVEENKVSCMIGNHEVTISCMNKFGLAVLSSCDDTLAISTAYLSEKYGEYSKAITLEFYPQTKQLIFSIAIRTNE